MAGDPKRSLPSRVRWRLVLALMVALLGGGTAFLAASAPAAADTALSTVACFGDNLVISTTGSQLGFGSYQLFGTGGPNLPATYDQAGTVTVAGPGNWTGLTIQQHNGVDFTLRDTIGNITCPPPGSIAQPITFATPLDRVFGEAPFAVSATGGASGNPVIFSSATFSVCTAGGTNGATITIVAAGTCTITANQAGNATYNNAASVTRSFNILKADQAIAFVLGGTRLFGSTFPVSAIGGASNNPVTFSSATMATCTVSGTTVTPVAIGTCTIAADQAGNDNYNAAPQVTQSVTIIEIRTVVVARGSATYGDTTATLTATVTSAGLPVPAGGQVRFTFRGAVVGTVPTNAQGVATLGVALPVGTQAGTFARQVLAEYLGDGTYQPSADTGPLVVARRILVAKASDRTVGLKQPNPSATPPAGCLAAATATSACWLELAPGSAFLPGDSWGNLNLTNLRFVYSRNYPSSNASETIGKTYKISAAGFSSANYDLRVQQGTLTVVAVP